MTATAIFASSWLLGLRFLWAQWVLFGLCSAACLLGLLVFLAGRRRQGLEPWAGWWISGAAAIAFLALIGVQSINIAFVPHFDINNCWLTPVPHLAWLPSSIGGPFDGRINGFIETENAARYLLIYGAGLLGCVGVGLGVRSHAHLRVLVAALVAHALLSAVICIAHQASGSTKILWLVGDPLYFMGAPFFFYKNLNAAYQVLLTGWLLGWLAWRPAREPARSPLAWFALFVLAEVGLASIRSRPGLLCAAVLAAADEIGLTLQPAEAALLAAVPAQQLQAVIDRIEQCVLALEIAVDGPGGDARFLGDHGHRSPAGHGRQR